MAKLALILVPTLALFLLFSLSHSLPSSDLNGRDVLLLPSDNPLPVPDGTDSPDVVADPKSAIATVPLTKLDFHEGGISSSLRFPHRHGFGHGCRHGFMRRHRMRPREIPYGNDMILYDKMDRPEEFVGRSRFHWVNRRPSFEVAVPWKGDEDAFKRPKKFERGYDEEEGMFKGPMKFGHHDEDNNDGFNQPKKFDHDEDDHMFEMVEKIKHDDDDHISRMPRKFKHDDDDEDWHREKHHRHRFGRHHHKHHHDDDEDDEAHKHRKRHHQEEDEEDDDEKGGFLLKMRKFFDDLF